MKVSLSWVAVAISLAVVQQVAAAPLESAGLGEANDHLEVREVLSGNSDEDPERRGSGTDLAKFIGKNIGQGMAGAITEKIGSIITGQKAGQNLNPPPHHHHHHAAHHPHHAEHHPHHARSVLEDDKVDAIAERGVFRANHASGADLNGGHPSKRGFDDKGPLVAELLIRSNVSDGAGPVDVDGRGLGSSIGAVMHETIKESAGQVLNSSVKQGTAYFLRKWNVKHVKRGVIPHIPEDGDDMAARDVNFSERSPRESPGGALGGAIGGRSEQEDDVSERSTRESPGGALGGAIGGRDLDEDPSPRSLDEVDTLHEQEARGHIHFSFGRGHGGHHESHHHESHHESHSHEGHGGLDHEHEAHAEHEHESAAYKRDDGEGDALETRRHHHHFKIGKILHTAEQIALGRDLPAEDENFAPRSLEDEDDTLHEQEARGHIHFSFGRGHGGHHESHHHESHHESHGHEGYGGLDHEHESHAEHEHESAAYKRDDGESDTLEARRHHHHFKIGKVLHTAEQIAFGRELPAEDENFAARSLEDGDDTLHQQEARGHFHISFGRGHGGHHESHHHESYGHGHESHGYGHESHNGPRP